MNISINFTIPDPVQLVVYLLIAALVTILGGGLARMHSPLGYFLTFVFALFGAWFFASILKLQIAGDLNVARVPLIEAFLGALLFGLVAIVAFGRRRRVVAYDE